MNTEDDEFDRIEREAKMKQESPKNMTKDEAMKLALETSEGIVNADWRKWDELASPSEFERWAKSRANFMATILREALAEQPAQQEPVAWLHTKIEGVAVPHRPADLDRHPDRWTPLYKDPAPCPTCEALARTVMLDQTSHDTSPPASKPLTDEEIKELYGDDDNFRMTKKYVVAFARAIEAKLKEKNT